MKRSNIKYTILEQLDDIIFQLNEDNNDTLNVNELKKKLITILALFHSLKDNFNNQYENNIDEKDIIANLKGTHESKVTKGVVSLSDEIKNNFISLFEQFLLKTKTQSDSSSNEDKGSFYKQMIEKYSKNNQKNILSENNETLTDKIIKKLKDINWKNNDIELIKNEIDNLKLL